MQSDKASVTEIKQEAFQAFIKKELLLFFEYQIKFVNYENFAQTKTDFVNLVVEKFSYSIINLLFVTVNLIELTSVTLIANSTWSWRERRASS